MPVFATGPTNQARGAIVDIQLGDQDAKVRDYAERALEKLNEAK
jgi:hypothetical protein